MRFTLPDYLRYDLSASFFSSLVLLLHAMRRQPRSARAAPEPTIEPSQYQASQLLDQICDLRVSLSTGGYVVRDDWGRRAPKNSGPRFASRAAAHAALRDAPTRLPLPPPPRANMASARRTSSRNRAPPRPPPRRLPAPPAYSQPPAPPAHLNVLSDGSSARGSISTRGSISEPPSTGPPSFSTMRDNSGAKPPLRAPSPGAAPPARRPRRTSAAALADILELSDEAVVARVFDADALDAASDEDNGPVSDGAGAVASVPRSPHARRSSASSNPPPVSPVAPPAGPSQSGLVRAIPDRPRAPSWAADDDDDEGFYFDDDAGFDVAPGDTAGSPAPGGRQRPQLREQAFASIKSYHARNLSADSLDTDTDVSDSDEASASEGDVDSTRGAYPASSSADRSDSTVASAGPGALRDQPAPLAPLPFDESDVSHSFDTTPVPRAKQGRYAGSRRAGVPL